MIGRAAVAAALVALALAAGAVLAHRQPSQPPFPHEAHERLFPVCAGCHLGILTGDDGELYPDPASCAECHDGVRQDVVTWRAAELAASNLRFHHPAHEQAVAAADGDASCATCHSPAGVPGRMTVTAAEPEACLACHAHEAPAHLADVADCRQCHLPLVEADRIPAGRIAGFPLPESHAAPDFVSNHAADAETARLACAVCHARETCERCHVNADRVAAISALGPDPRVAFLEIGREAEYPPPATHADPAWSWGHGASAEAEAATCSNCHIQDGCVSCHLDGAARIEPIRALPVPVAGGAPGVPMAGVEKRVHPPDFDLAHGTWAASGILDCAACHTRQSCSDCHAGMDSRRFHPANFMERHAMEVFAGRTSCQSCHSTETFCRACHVDAGLGSQGRLNVAFHTGLWVLAHGQAARAGLESCASCHAQTDCLACHSADGGWRVNPHGPGFDADRMAARNGVTCQWCHRIDPRGAR